MDGSTLRTVQMRPVPGVAQACRIVAVPGGGDVILEGPADVLDVIRLVPLHDDDQAAGTAVLPDVDDAGAVLDWVRVIVQARYGAHHPTAAPPPT